MEDDLIEDGGWDNQHYDEDKNIDWSESEVLYVHDCDKLELNLQEDSTTKSKYIQDLMYGALFILENVAELTIETFEVGEKKLQDGKKDNGWVIIKYRHSYYTTVCFLLKASSRGLNPW